MTAAVESAGKFSYASLILTSGTLQNKVPSKLKKIMQKGSSNLQNSKMEASGNLHYLQ